MNCKTEKAEKKPKELRHQRSRRSNLLKDKENLAESRQSVESDFTRTHGNKQSTTTEEFESRIHTTSPVHPVNSSNSDQLKVNISNGSDLTIDTSLKKCCQLLTALNLSQSRCSGNNIEAGSIDDAAGVRVQIRVDRKTRTKSNKRTAAGKTTRKSYRHEGRKNCDTIQLNILLVDNEQSEELASDRKEDSKNTKTNAKHIVKLAGKRLWKGVRVSCKFLWSGLVLYAKPLAETEMNCAKVWEDKTEDEGKSQYSDYSDDARTSERKHLNRGA